MKKTICKKVCTGFAIFFMLVFLVFTKSTAMELGSLSSLFPRWGIGDTIYLARDDVQTSNATAYMAGSDYIYCFQHSKYLDYDKYQVIGAMTIEGHNATGYNEDWTKVSKNSLENIALGYILSEGSYYKGYSAYGNHTIRQRALWHYGDTWMSSVGKSFGLSWTVEDNTKSTDSNTENGKSWGSLKSDAETYANKGWYSTPKVTFNSSTVTSYNNTINGAIIGPINVNFNDYDANNRIHVKSIEVKGVNNTTIPSSSISFYSDADGKNSISVNDIKQNKNFYIKNNSNLDVKGITVNLETDLIYKVYVWFLTNTYAKCDEECQKALIADVQNSYRNTASGTVDIKSTGSLYIHKADEETGATLEGAGFKIYKKNSGWLKGTSAPYEFVNDINQATEYTMDNNNKTAHVQYGNIAGLPAQYQGKKGLKIDGLRSGTYHVYETKAPSGLYELKLQNGYDSNNKYVDTGIEIKVGKYQTDGTTWDHFRKITNVLKISIVGRVWEEGIPDKGSFEDYDSKYSEVDDPLPEIIVRLKNKKTGNPVITNSKGDDFVLTDANGMYKFDSLIKKTELENYYVEFDYSSKNAEDTHYIRYIPVAFNQDKTNGSKALAIIPTQDREVKGIATTYTGEDRNQIATYGLEKTGTYNAQTLTLGDINLGIKPLLDPEYDLRENIADLKLTIKGYTYTYVYGGKGKKDNFVGNGENGPAVKWQNSQDMYAYSREMYPSDIIYDKNSSKQELDALVTYRIDVTNTMGENTKELYQQTDKLILTRIENQYDTKRYELVDSNWKDENGSGTATMNDNYKQTVYNNGVGSNDTATSYITFKVKEEALEKILENPDGIIEENPTKITTEAYHTYYRDDYMWENLGKTGKNIDGVKYKENLHQTRNKVKEEKAPYLVFSIDEQRTISGKVFEDKVISNNGEKLGDGIYNEGIEKGVEGVKVELLDIGGTAPTLSHLYQGIKNAENKKIEEKIVDAIVTTNSEGEYRLEGVVPGRYYLRFIYGNGDYRVTNLKGEEVEKGHLSTKLEGKEINAKEYKSTIIKSSIVENALKFVEQITDSMTEEQKQAYEKQLIEDTYTWYKKDEFKEQKYSVAVDDLNVRKALNESQENLNAEALSPQISVTIENTKNNSATESEGNDNKIDGAKDESGKTVSNISILNNKKENVKNIFEGFYFGIIETPKQNAEIEKIITNVKLTNAQGNILYNGNPENVSTQGAGAVSVSDLDNKKNGGSSYVRAEMVEESLYGSSLELTYEVRITNTSDVNYYNTEYYVYGQKKDNKEVTLKPIVVKEYLDETLKYEEEKSQKDRIEEVNPNVAETINVEGKDVKAQEFNLNGWSTLYTNKITNRDQEHPTTDKVTLVATRILSKEDDDMEIVSRAEIKEIEHTPDPKDNEEDKVEQLRTAAKEVHTNGMEKATFTITPPTGKDKNNVTLYAIVGTISLAILATGIVILKKKV